MTATILKLGDPALHFFLTRSVARALGVNLSDAMTEGDLSAQGYAELVTRCRTCPHVGACQLWLAQSDAGASGAPDHCLNKAALDILKEGSSHGIH